MATTQVPKESNHEMNPLFDKVSMDRTSLSVSSLADEPNDAAFWATKTSAERLAAMEYLRVINYGYDPSTARLQRLLTITRLGEG